MQLPQLPSLSKLRPNQIAIMLVVGLVVVVGFIAFYYFSRGGTTGPAVALTVWGTDDAQAFAGVTAGYSSIRPNVTVTYVHKDAATYDRDLLNALAAGEGPDVYEIDGHDVGTNLSRIVPAPVATVGPIQVRTFFSKAIEQDMVVGTQVYALPLYMDTLALLYNKDLLDAGGIVNAPATWDALQEDVAKLRSVNEQGQVVRAAVALGGSMASIPQGTDILNALMLQNGSSLPNASSTFVDFGQEGAKAFNFYLQFANPLSPYYTWSDTFGNAVQRFAKGDVAMMAGYTSTLEAVKRQNAFLDVRVAPLPQAAGGTPRTYADYKALVVSKQSLNGAWAWDFVTNVAETPGVIQPYLAFTHRPPALLSLVALAGNEDADVFTKQTLIARSWYEVDGSAVADLLNQAILSASNGSVPPEQALRAAADRISLLFRTAI